MGVTVVLWASAFVGIRSVGHTFAPGPLALGRLLIGAVTLGMIVAVKRGPVLPRGNSWWFILAYGVAWFAAYNVALNASERHLDAGTSSILVQGGPLLIALFAGLLLKEGFPPRLLAGSVTALIGAVIVGAASGGGRHTDLFGVVLCLVAALMYAIGVTAQKPALARTSALSATWFGCLIGAVACLPFAPDLWSEGGDASAGAIAGLVYLGVFPTAIAFTTWAYALGRMPAGQLGATTYLVPVLATLLSWIILDEAPAALSFVGGALCLAGVAITRSKATIRRGTRPRPAQAGGLGTESRIQTDGLGTESRTQTDGPGTEDRPQVPVESNALPGGVSGGLADRS
ncbi:DMT family transporter [Frankia sp. AiPa1]|nr:DMT family transporter [Frankia sp. AiPa1]